MLISTGNNFGAQQIVFKDYQGQHEIVLNAVVTFDPSNADYQAADQLEIYVPDLVFTRSAIAGAFLAGTGSLGPVGTVVKTWIKNKNTIVVEKLTAWDSCSALTIYFCTMYGLRGFRNFSIDVLESSGIALKQSDFMGTPSDYMYYETPDWVFIAFSLGEFYYSVEPQNNFISNCRDFPEDIDAVVPFISGWYDPALPGANIHPVPFKGNQLRIHDLPQHMSASSAWWSYLYAFIVRDRDKTPDVPGRLLWKVDRLDVNGRHIVDRPSLEMTPAPAMMVADMEASLYNSVEQTYNVENVPEGMIGWYGYFMGTATDGRFLCVHLIRLELKNEGGGNKLTITGASASAYLSFCLCDTSAAMQISEEL